jgi:hypothetical protein
MIVDNSDLETLAIVETPYKATDLAKWETTSHQLTLAPGEQPEGSLLAKDYILVPSWTTHLSSAGVVMIVDNWG